MRKGAEMERKERKPCSICVAQRMKVLESIRRQQEELTALAEYERGCRDRREQVGEGTR